MSRYTVKGNVWGYLVWDTVEDKAASPYTYLQDAKSRAKALNEAFSRETTATQAMVADMERDGLL